MGTFLRIAIIGAGNAVFSRRTFSDLCELLEFRGSKIVLTDVDRQRLGNVRTVEPAFLKHFYAWFDARIKLPANDPSTYSFQNWDTRLITEILEGDWRTKSSDQARALIEELCPSVLEETRKSRALSPELGA